MDASADQGVWIDEASLFIGNHRANHLAIR